MDGEELTAQQTALYDRQIRVWGVDAQKRLSKANVLVSGLNGTLAEFCKNIVLAGVGSLTLMDDRLVTEDSIHANFLITPEEAEHSRSSLAEVYCNSLKEFNPMVHVSVEKGALAGMARFSPAASRLFVASYPHSFEVPARCKNSSLVAPFGAFGLLKA